MGGRQPLLPPFLRPPSSACKSSKHMQRCPLHSNSSLKHHHPNCTRAGPEVHASAFLDLTYGCLRHSCSLRKQGSVQMGCCSSGGGRGLGCSPVTRGSGIVDRRRNESDNQRQAGGGDALCQGRLPQGAPLLATWHVSRSGDHSCLVGSLNHERLSMM